MSKLPLDQAIKRFQANDERMDVFANGTDTQSYQASSGSLVPSVRKFLKDKDDEINAAADSILSGAEDARDAAQASAQSASDDADAVAAQVGALAAPTGAGTVGTTPAGGLAATNVQSALNELDTEKATVTSMNLKANIASPTFTGTVGGVTKTMVGLGNVDNTSDADKPVSTATASGLATKEVLSNKDVSNGYAGLDLFKLKMRNVANTITSYLTNSNTASRTYTWPDKSGTIALLDDLAGGSLQRLATITPTASATVDFLTSFDASYDNYLIIFDGIQVNAATDKVLRYRFAVAGVVDSGSNYFGSLFGTATSSSDTSAIASVIFNNASAAGSGKLEVFNANDAIRLKTGTSFYMQKLSSGSYNTNQYYSAYIAANAISGIRFYWQTGENFLPQGTIRIYGYKNS